MLRNGKTVSVVVPIYNEEKTLKGVIDTLLEGELFDEIICINDGSTDKSKEILDSLDPKVRVIHLEENKGKGYAMVEGTKAANSELIFFFDADFDTPKIEPLNDLVNGMLGEDVDAVVGTFFEKKDLRKLTMDPINGQRVYYKKDIEPLYDQIADSRWGVEVLLNKAFKDRNVVNVLLKGLGHLNKHEKHSPKDAIQEYIQEGVEMGKALVPANKLNLEDNKILNKLYEVKDFVEFEKLTEKIKNTELKTGLLDYLNRYLSEFKDWLESN